MKHELIAIVIRVRTAAVPALRTICSRLRNGAGKPQKPAINAENSELACCRMPGFLKHLDLRSTWLGGAGEELRFPPRQSRQA